MAWRKKHTNVLLIILSILLIIGTITVYIIGERKFKESEKKKITGAKEVITNNVENDLKVEQNNVIASNLQQVSNENAIKAEALLKLERFKGLPLKYNDKGLPILMYHSIDREVDKNTGKLNELRVPKEVFREQMKFLKDNGYTTLTMNEIYDFFENNKGIPEKSIGITFDDGYLDNYTNAYPVLKEFGFNATIFMITDYVGKVGGYMTSEQLKELDASGIEIQPHTATHQYLGSISADKQLKDMKDSKEFLENLLNKKAEFIAYPYGSYNGDTLKLAKELGFRSGFLADGPWAYKKDGMYLYRRVYVSSLKGMDSFIDRITNSNYTK